MRRGRKIMPILCDVGPNPIYYAKGRIKYIIRRIKYRILKKIKNGDGSCFFININQCMAFIGTLYENSHLLNDNCLLLSSPKKQKKIQTQYKTTSLFCFFLNKNVTPTRSPCFSLKLINAFSCLVRLLYTPRILPTIAASFAFTDIPPTHLNSRIMIILISSREMLIKKND